MEHLQYENYTHIFKNKTEFETVRKYLEAFQGNFGELRIERPVKTEGFYVYFPYNKEDYIQYCYNADYFAGWLNGVIQGTMRGEFKPFRTGSIKD